MKTILLMLILSQPGFISTSLISTGLTVRIPSGICAIDLFGIWLSIKTPKNVKIEVLIKSEESFKGGVFTFMNIRIKWFQPRLSIQDKFIYLSLTII